MGPEQAVHGFFDWLVRLVRSRPAKTDQLAQFWMSVSWKLALEMRGGRTFSESTTAIMKDYDSFTECMNREPTNIIKKASTNATAKPEPPKGQGKGNTKSGKGTRVPTYTRQTKPWSWGPYDRADKASASWQSSSKQEDKQGWQRDAWSSDWKTSPK